MNNEINNNQSDNNNTAPVEQQLTTPLPTITPITPTPINETPQVETPPTPVVPITPDATPNQAPVVSITPEPAPAPVVPTVQEQTPEVQVQTGDNLTPNIVVPEMKNETRPQPESNVQNIQPQLNIETASPFDIGVNAPLNTTTDNIAVNVASSVPTANNNTESTKQQPQNDININEPTNSTAEIVSVGQYILYNIIFFIPLLGFIMLIIKALDKKNKNISNFAKSILIMQIIIFIIVIALIVLLPMLGLGNVTTTTYYN